MKCIYCKKESPEISFSKEHIIPESIGGNLTINTVCKECNDFLGNTIDVILVDNFLIKIIRAALGIENKSNKLPNPLSGGYLASNPNVPIVQYYNKESKTLEYKVAPHYFENDNEDGSKSITVSGDGSDDLEKRMRTVLQRKGLESNSNVKSETTIHKKSKVEKVEYTSGLSIILPLLKIAYSLSYYWLGEQYLNDRTATFICKTITSPPDLSTVHSARENLMGIGITFNYFSNLFFDNWNHETCSHIALLKREKKNIVCYVRIFNVIEAQILTSIDSKLYPNFQDKFLLIQPIRDTKVDRNLSEELRNITTIVSDFDLKWIKEGDGHWFLQILKEGKEIYTVRTEINFS